MSLADADLDAGAATTTGLTQDTPIPRTINYCWVGQSPLTALGQHCLQTWRKVMPDYVLERWDESRLNWDTPYLAIAYRARKFAFVSDYIRLQALYENGGLYFDTDIEALRPFDELLGCELFMGLQTSDSIGAGVIGAVRGHPFLKLALDRLDAEAKSGKPSFQPLPELITELARANRAIAPTLFPEEFFYPYNPYSPDPLRQKPLQSHISERTFAIHHWEGTWLGGMSLGMMISLRLKDRLRRAHPKHWRRSLADHGDFMS